MIINSIEGIKEFAATRRAKIRAARDNLSIAGKTYYVSADGNDKNDGRSPESAWKRLKKYRRQSFFRVTAFFFKGGTSSAGWLLQSQA